MRASTGAGPSSSSVCERSRGGEKRLQRKLHMSNQNTPARASCLERSFAGSHSLVRAHCCASRCSLVCPVGLCVRPRFRHNRTVIGRPEPEIVRPTPPCRGTTAAPGRRPARRSRAHGTRVASCLSSRRLWLCACRQRAVLARVWQSPGSRPSGGGRAHA